MKMGKNFLDKYRIIIVCGLGNFLEFYDFALNGVFIVQITKMFFSSDGIQIFYLGGVLSFSIAYLSRPIGALVWGYIGDKVGWSNSLSLSLIVMSVPNIIIGFLPIYDVIGLVAPVILLLCRFIQGICIGGEYSGSAIIVLDRYSDNKGVMGGFLCSSAVGGALFASILGYMAITSSFSELCFRGLYVFGGIIALVGFIVRKHLLSNIGYLGKKRSEALYERSSFIQVLKSYKLRFVLIVLIGSINGILSFAFLTSLNMYLSQYIGVDRVCIHYSSWLHMLVIILGSPLFGYLSNLIGITKYIKIVLSCLIPTVFFMFYFLTVDSDNEFYVMCGQLVAGLMAASYIGPSFSYYQNILPDKIKYTGIALGCSTGMSLTAGTLPLVWAYSVSCYGLWGPAYIMSLVFIIALLCLLILESKSKKY